MSASADAVRGRRLGDVTSAAQLQCGDSPERWTSWGLSDRQGGRRHGWSRAGRPVRSGAGCDLGELVNALISARAVVFGAHRGDHGALD